ncbi:rare lipoprotein A [Nitrosomonas sp. PY1]|uniref:septal ring lytic transglycosylase RlpA family protein n=1 Tax=Nitrosomonas sp. PY1 TaxID=1803906 RepID=UPI001FC7E900|nr:septal ring lytic transglycosylase RlpA family protein [Nitrosomonas sp. PY1]GKS68634.1 rare lipoprotein A [Nitrosomonas sp. PY1]
MNLPSVYYWIAFMVALLTACSNTPSNHLINQKPSGSIINSNITKKGGGYYLNDGPDDNPPPNLHLVPDAIPKTEPLRTANMRPYFALGKHFRPMTELQYYKERGVASWYGRRYHGSRTASGEPYDMYAMTAAHPTLPIPSYARITSVENGRSVIVRINDRGPFLGNRLIDLSYTAAYKLGVLSNGSGQVEVETILPTQYHLSGQATTFKPLVTPRQQKEIGNLTIVPGNTATSPVLNKIYVQLGAFGSQGNAHYFMAHVKDRLAWFQDPIRVIEHGGLHKIHAGPYSDSSHAERIASSIRQELAIKPILVYD